MRGRLIAKVLPGAAGLGLGAGFLLLCLNRGTGRAYAVFATVLFVFVAASLVFVLLTGRVRLGASYDSEGFHADDLRIGRVAGSLIATTVLVLLIVGALEVGPGHTIQTGLSWYAVHGGDLKDNLEAVIADSVGLALAVAATIALGRAIWRRDWGRALTCLWVVLALWSLTTAWAGGWAITRSHQWWWVYPWALGWFGVAIAFLLLAGRAQEAADRKQKRQDRLRERKDARSDPGGEPGITQPEFWSIGSPLDEQPEGTSGGSPGGMPIADTRDEI